MRLASEAHSFSLLVHSDEAAPMIDTTSSSSLVQVSMSSALFLTSRLACGINLHICKRLCIPNLQSALFHLLLKVVMANTEGSCIASNPDHTFCMQGGGFCYTWSS